MAVPSSGQIHMSGIWWELNDDDYDVTEPDNPNVSLTELSDGTEGTINTGSASYPNGSAPHEMSEFYSYDHDTVVWDNDDDWYDDSGTLWLDSYLKHRVDFGYNTSFGGQGDDVTDVSSWEADGEIISSAVHTASTSTSTPGYLTCDGSNDCANSYDAGPLISNWNPFGGNGQTVFVWFRRHTSTNSVIWCASNGSNGNQNLLAIKSKTNGKIKVGAQMDSNMSWCTTADAVSNNVWICLAMTTRSFQGNKGTSNGVQVYLRDDNGPYAMSTMDPASSTEALTTEASVSKTPPWGIGCYADSASSPSSVFDGDVAFAAVYNYGSFGGTADSKLNEIVRATEGKFGLS